MSIKDYLSMCDAYELFLLVNEMASNYDHYVGKFNSCIDELEWFEKHGIKNRLDDCSGNCIECELAFLEQEVIS